MSASRIIAQGCPALIVSFPGWRLPTFCRARANVAGSGVVTPATDSVSTPGCSITQVGSGIYLLNFPRCRDISGIVGRVVAPTGIANQRLVIPGSGTPASAAAGQTSLTIVNPTGPAVADPVTGSVIVVDFWLELG